MPAQRQDDVTAVVPLKALGAAKSRLAADLDERLRRDLASWMCGRVVRACQAAESVGEVLVVAGDREAAVGRGVTRGRGAAGHRAGAAGRPGGRGRATGGPPPRRWSWRRISPLARGEDLERICRAGAAAPAVVVAPTVDGGTGALLRRPAGVIATAYGPSSAAAHTALAEQAGLTAVRLDLAELALDVDTPEALEEAGRRSSAVQRWRRRMRGRAGLPVLTRHVRAWRGET